MVRYTPSAHPAIMKDRRILKSPRPGNTQRVADLSVRSAALTRKNLQNEKAQKNQVCATHLLEEVKLYLRKINPLGWEPFRTNSSVRLRIVQSPCPIWKKKGFNPSSP
jgi:hypothetical protein